jgi:BirA family biotin operon repressor/biotin-[acetyl-CoA-carboxylase] ligase
MQLDPAVAGFRVSAHDSLPSTNAEALTLARRGEGGPLWITARQQTSGRGRRGNTWISTPGNLYATLLVCDPSQAANAPELSFVAALAVHDAILDRAGALRDKLALKWPNDVLYAMQKLAGILIESEAAGAGLAVAIGIGVNCMHHPTETAYPATDLASAGANVSTEDLFFALTGTMARRLVQWDRGTGFAAIRGDWMARATEFGGEMRVRLPGREFIGRGEALDEQGRLLLRLPDGTLQTITAGDVFPVASSGQGVH